MHQSCCDQFDEVPKLLLSTLFVANLSGEIVTNLLILLSWILFFTTIDLPPPIYTIFFVNIRSKLVGTWSAFMVTLRLRPFYPGEALPF
jgi:hypothetical protein